MKRYFLPIFFLAGLGACSPVAEPLPERPAYALAIHGGAGTILKENMPEELEAEYRKTLHEALDIGEAILKEGGTAMDAVEKTIIYMEDSPLFNAGKGAVLTWDGIAELDASIMDGSTQKAGAVGGMRTIRNPILAARAVMEASPHVLLTGTGADAFAVEQGLDTVSNDYFITDRRLESWKRSHQQQGQRSAPLPSAAYFGTVGCVALDQAGNLAAGTSTGGMQNKRYNRFGDSPIIGAGTYADNATCAVSCTGHGEYFIRYAVAHDLSARMAYLGEDVVAAGDAIIQDRLPGKGGTGGLVAVDYLGRVAMPFNTPGMYRGYARPKERFVGIYKDE